MSYRVLSAAAAEPTQSSVGQSGRGEVFRYDGYEIDPVRRQLTCRYELDGRQFTEVIAFAAGGSWHEPAVTEISRLVFLLCGVSYYKTAAPPVIDLGDIAVTEKERDFLLAFYRDGLGEFAYRNELDLSELRIKGPTREPRPAFYQPEAERPLVPFGGGVDSIVTVELIKTRTSKAALFVANRPDDRFDAIELPAVVTGLPVIRAERLIDEQLLRSRQLGFLNGHVPVTGILSAIAVMAAVLDGRDAVVMSNEWSASIETMNAHGRSINHQYSKSIEFEAGFRAVLKDCIPTMDYFSVLRPFSELWIAREFAALEKYFNSFRSCNRAFHIDQTQRLDHWCGQCDKCCFIDLILAPFVPKAKLQAIFHGHEPLDNSSLRERFCTLLGLLPDAKPWECVGDVEECRAALVLAAARPDRADAPLVQSLAHEAKASPHQTSTDDLLRPLGNHFIPDNYAANSLLV